MDDDNFQVVIDIPPPPSAGEVATLLCTVVPPDRFVLDLESLFWSYDPAGNERVADNPDATIGSIVRQPNYGNFTLNVTLDPVKTSDAGRIFCDYSVDVVNDDGVAQLTVNSKYIICTYYIHHMILYSSIS